jgi:hypothetical protein
MCHRFKVRFGKPEKGSITVDIKSMEQQLLFIASSIPYNSFFELVDALIVLINGYSETIVRWNTEPIEYEFNLSRNNDEITLEVVRFPDSRKIQSQGEVVFRINDSYELIVLPFWRALRQMEFCDNFEEQWGRTWPKREMMLLNKLIEGFRRCTNEA